MKKQKELITIQILFKYFSELKKTLKDVSGFRDCYPLTSAEKSEDNLEVQIVFSHLNGSSKRYLRRFLNRRKAKIINSLNR